MSKRRNHSATFKAKVALAAIQGAMSPAELASKYEVHATQIGSWRKKAVEGMADLFADGRRTRSETTESREDELYAEIGRLKMELDWLKKKLR
jgi:transposase-like protein